MSAEGVTPEMVRAFLSVCGRHFPFSGSDPAIAEGIAAAIAAAPAPIGQRYWLCCGSLDPLVHRRNCKEAQMGFPEHCRYGTVEEHSEFCKTLRR